MKMKLFGHKSEFMTDLLCSVLCQLIPKQPHFVYTDATKFTGNQWFWQLLSVAGCVCLIKYVVTFGIIGILEV